MTDGVDLLRTAKSVLLVDWPSRDVPDTLARGGFAVTSSDGPDEYNAYEVEQGSVRVRSIDAVPELADLVYTHRPIEELPEIVNRAKSVGARAVWFQSGRSDRGAKDPRGCWMPPDDARRARAIVEKAGLSYIESPYIADAVRALKAAT